MGWLDEIRAAKPEFANLPDRELADAAYPLYADQVANRAEFDQRIGRVTTTPIEQAGPIPQVPGAPPVQYTADGLPFYGPQTETGGAFPRARQGASEAYGDRPVGLPSEFKDSPIAATAIRATPPGAAVAAIDATLRSLHAAVVGGSGGIADLAEMAGMDKTTANKLHRDLKMLVDTAMVVAGTGNPIPRPGAQVRTGGPRAAEGAPAVAAEAEPAAPAVAAPARATAPVESAALAPDVERIVAAAIKVDDEIFTGPTHASAAQKVWDRGIDISTNPADIDGFVTSTGRYVGREEAAKIATAAKQTSEPGAARLEANALRTSETRAAEIARLEQVANEADAVLAEQPGQILAREAVDANVRTAREAERPPNRAGNINLDRIYAPEDVKAAIKQTADDNAEFINARRGVVTHEETRDMAQLLGMNADDLAKRRKGQAFNAEEMFAARELLVAQATKVRDLARRVEGGTDIDKAAFAEAMTRLVAIQEQVSGATAEAGRALNQFKMMAGATREEIAAIVEAAKVRGIEDMAAQIRGLNDVEQVGHFAANAFKASKWDMVYEAWINALLSGPQTHAANTISNSLTALLSVPESALAATISKMTGSGISMREPLARVVGAMEGAREGIPAAWESYRTQQATGTANKLEMRREHRAIPSVEIGGHEFGGKQVRIPGRLLMAEDEFFKAVGYRQEIAALATRQAVNEGHKGKLLADRIAELKANPTEEMITAARNAAEKQTFTNPLGKAGQGLSQFVKEFPGLRYVVPFIRTPINLVKYAGERSPFAPVSTLFGKGSEVGQNILGKNGPIARDNQIARIGLGSTLGGVTAYLALQNNITGAGTGQSEGAKRALMRSDKWQPYSIRIGDDYYGYNRLEPFGMIMGVTADMVEMYDHMTKDEKASIAALITGSIARNLVSKTWLRGPSDAIQAINDPERYGPRYLQGMLGTAVPNVLAQYARTRDPYIRETRTILDNIRSRIPGEREKLFVRRDAFGEPIKMEGGLGPDLISPIAHSTAKNDPLIAEMLRLRVHPGRLPRVISNADLTPEEYATYTESAGKEARRRLDGLVNQPNWRELPESDQLEQMNRAIRQGREIGRSMTREQHPDLQLRIKAATAKKKRTAPAEAE